MGVGCVNVLTGQSSRSFVGDKYRKEELIADHSADEIRVLTINGISGRAESPLAAVAKHAEGLSSAGVELAGTPRKRADRGVRGGMRETPRGWEKLLVGLLEVGLPGGMVVYTRWSWINNSPGNVNTVHKVARISSKREQPLH